LKGYRGMHRDPEELKAAAVTKGTLMRIWQFLRPYRARLGVYLLTILAAAGIGSIPSLR